jgi:hypothetical protein
VNDRSNHQVTTQAQVSESFQRYINNEQQIVSGIAKAAGHMGETFEDYVQSTAPLLNQEVGSPTTARAQEESGKLKQLRAEVGKLVMASNHLASKFSDYTAALTESPPTVAAFGTGTRATKNRPMSAGAHFRSPGSSPRANLQDQWQGNIQKVRRRRKTPSSARTRPRTAASKDALFSAVRPSTASKVRPGPASAARRAKWTREHFKDKAQFDFVIAKLVSVLSPPRNMQTCCVRRCAATI